MKPTIKKDKLMRYILKNAEANIWAREKLDAYDCKALDLIKKLTK